MQDTRPLDRRFERHSEWMSIAELSEMQRRLRDAQNSLQEMGYAFAFSDASEAALAERLVGLARENADLTAKINALILREVPAAGNPVQKNDAAAAAVRRIFAIPNLADAFGIRGLAAGQLLAELWLETAIAGARQGSSVSSMDAQIKFFDVMINRQLQAMESEAGKKSPRYGWLKDRVAELRKFSRRPLREEEDRRLAALEAKAAREPRPRAKIPNSVLQAMSDPLKFVNFSIMGFAADDRSQAESLAASGTVNDFFSNWWWRNSTLNGYSQIAGDTSKSLAAQLYNPVYGKDWKRTIHWPIGEHHMGNERSVDLSQIRVAVNQAPNGAPLSMEVLLKDRRGNWEPMFFERDGSRWRLQSHVQGRPVAKVCIGCHGVAKGWIFRTTRLSPLPNFLRTEEALRGVGYKDEALIRELLSF